MPRKGLALSALVFSQERERDRSTTPLRRRQPAICTTTRPSPSRRLRKGRSQTPRWVAWTTPVTQATPEVPVTGRTPCTRNR